MNIIAEFGCNWNTIADFETMVLMCKEMGIKFIKMQMFKPDMVPKEVRKMYIGKGRAKYFFNFAKSYGIELFFTPMYPEAVDILEEIGVNYYKVRFGNRYDFDLYRKIKKTKKPVFVSCQRIPKLWKNMSNYTPDRVNFLYCIPKYPSTTKEYLVGLIRNYNFRGVSDHTPDLTLFKFAEAGRSIDWFEMHVCLDRETAYEGAWSKELRELKEVL